MTIAVFPKSPENEAPDFKPWDAPDLLIDWARFGRFVQAFRTKIGADRTLMAHASGVERGHIEMAERIMPLPVGPFLRLCVFLNRQPTFFCKTVGGWQPHPPQ